MIQTDAERMNFIRDDWFKEHEATYEKLSNDTVVLTFKKPNTNMYYVRYILDKNALFITGDIGDAVFCLTEKADLKTLATDYNNHYLFSKLRADREAYDFNTEKAIKAFKEYFGCEYLDTEDFDEDEKEKYNELVDDFIVELRDECTSSDMLSHILSSEYYDRISEFDADCSEWAFDLGKELSWQALGWVVGLKMAYEQLKEELN